jgi:hypothetical protein
LGEYATLSAVTFSPRPMSTGMVMGVPGQERLPPDDTPVTPPVSGST